MGLVSLQTKVPETLKSQLKREAKSQGMLFQAYVVGILEGRAKKSKTTETAIKPVNYTDRDVDLVNLLFELMRQNNLDLKRKPSVDDYSEMRKMREIDNRDPRMIEAVIKWSQQDSFWHKNILSVTKLRKQYDKLYLEAKSQTQTNRVISI